MSSLRSIGGTTAGVAARTADAPGIADAMEAAASTRATSSGPAAAGAGLLNEQPLRPTGALRDALDGGRLLRTGTSEHLDHLELVLRTGAIDEMRAIAMGGGINGPLRRVPIADPLGQSASDLWAVEKPAGAQAAQEELGWRLARAMGIDHLVPPVARRADGTARIEFRPGETLGRSDIRDAEQLEAALASTYWSDPTLALTSDEARHAGVIDRQLLQAFDYLLANNDRHAGNGLYDAATGTLSFIDSGHAGRGALRSNGGTELEPALRMFQAGPTGGRVNLDPVVVKLIGSRVDADTIRSLHSAVFDAPGIAGPQTRTLGEKFLPHVRSTSYRDGMIARLEHLLEHGGYSHREYAGDNAGELPALQSLGNVRGLQAVRAAMHGGGMFGGGFDRF